jgi:hypothetical protein
MPEKLATVGTFSTPTEANIVRNHLEADGIRAFLADEAIVGMAWHLGTAVGGVKLQDAEDWMRQKNMRSDPQSMIWLTVPFGLPDLVYCSCRCNCTRFGSWRESHRIQIR